MTILLYDLCGADRSHRFSPYCWRVRMALAHKGLPFTTLPVPFTAIADATGGASETVPVIDDGGTRVRDSFDIALHLERTYPDAGAPLWRDDAAIGMARLIETLLTTNLHPIITRMIVLEIHDALAPEDQAYFRSSREARLGQRLEDAQAGIEALREAFNRALSPFGKALGEQSWLGGSEPDFRDHILFGSLQWLRAIHGDLPLDEVRLTDWLSRLEELYGGLASPRLAGAGATG